MVARCGEQRGAHAADSQRRLATAARGRNQGAVGVSDMKRRPRWQRSRAERLTRMRTRRLNESTAADAPAVNSNGVAEVVRPRGSGVDRATFRRGEYGRIVRPDGSEHWWVRSARGTWIALSHQRVMENDDGTITLLLLT